MHKSYKAYYDVTIKIKSEAYALNTNFDILTLQNYIGKFKLKKL